MSSKNYQNTAYTRKESEKAKKAAAAKKRKITIGVIAAAIIIIVLIAVFAGKGSDFKGGTYYADIVVKDYGTITVSLDGDTAPATVENFIKLAEDGIYDGLTFHRIMEGFMMQGGDPNGNGVGDDGLDTVVGEFSANGYENNISHVRGTISMARSQEYNSASSQFFIVQQDSTFLDGQYAGFGTVVEGMEIVDQICQESNPTDNNGSIPEAERPIIETVTIREAE
ncbi:MAG: peptidylprolyl isomerase [Ruminococcaceae bacterium]|nr:peptidylprolyl isomerase [Oscillospiraceae bacterium]